MYASENFTAFGDRRNPATWSGAPTSTDLNNINAVTRDGYTDQTALGNMGLNHMNGRVEDAITGRFLSADPYITEPGNTQNYNRYSYVYNNPMTNVDPSGFDCQVYQTGYISVMTTTWTDIEGTQHSDSRSWDHTQWNSNCFDSDPGATHTDTPTPDIHVPTPGNYLEEVDVNGVRRDDSKCWNGEQGNALNTVSGLLRQIGNDLNALGVKMNPFGGVMTRLGLLPVAPFGHDHTNAGIFGADLAPAVEIAATGGDAAVERFASLKAGTQGAREFLGLVGNRSVQMDHTFLQSLGRTGGGSSYWNLYPVSAELNRLMGQANNWTLSTQAILRGALARFINNGKLGGAAGASLFAGQAVGGAIAENGGCN